MPTTCVLPDAEAVPHVPLTAPFDDPAWMFEPMYDGFRSLLYASGGACEFRAPLDRHFEGFTDLRDRVTSVLGGREAILDGRVVSLDRNGKPIFRELLKGRGYLAFAASDLLWLDGHDLRPMPLAERKRRLGELLPSDTGPLYKVFTLEEHGRALYQAARRMDLAGIAAKRRDDPYARETIWYRISNPAYRQGQSRVEMTSTPARARREVGES